MYDAAEVLEPGSFDLVYTGIGALCWLPDIRRWGAVVAGPAAAGRAAVHPRGPPMLSPSTIDRDGRLVVTDPYFETAEPRVCDYAGTYVQTDAVFEHTVTHGGTTASARSSPPCSTRE